MKHLWNTTESYEDNDGYIVDIVSLDMGAKFEAWIYHKDYGIKMFMFGIEANSMMRSEFTDLALNQYKGYIGRYKDSINE